VLSNLSDVTLHVSLRVTLTISITATSADAARALLDRLKRSNSIEAETSSSVAAANAASTDFQLSLQQIVLLPGIPSALPRGDGSVGCGLEEEEPMHSTADASLSLPPSKQEEEEEVPLYLTQKIKSLSYATPSSSSFASSPATGTSSSTKVPPHEAESVEVELTATSQPLTQMLPAVSGPTVTHVYIPARSHICVGASLYVADSNNIVVSSIMGKVEVQSRLFEDQNLIANIHI